VQRDVEDAVAASEHQSIGHLVREAETRRPPALLVEVQLVDDLACLGPEHGTLRIEIEPQRAADAVDILRRQVLVVAQAKVDRRARRHAPVVLQVEAGTPLPDAADWDALGGSRGSRKTHDERRRGTSGDARERCAERRVKLVASPKSRRMSAPILSA
jgi:hypothetical protein